ncbi:MAG: superoxide dismutase family protein [Fidelibacterota bacterium]|nr:MAG: superoxide dismutase family protein [Candidatus Neomarinimicrobiota bacterium]
MRIVISAVAIVFIIWFLTAILGAETPTREEGATRAIAVLYPTGGNGASGSVRFIQADHGVRVVAQLHGLTPGPHGFHIHQYGDCSAPDASSAGGHFNPTGAPHAGPDTGKRHLGDLGNIIADETGNAYLDVVDHLLTLEGPNGIVGRAVVLHAGADDLTSQPSGAAGPRIACGVIGIAGRE